MYNLKYKTDYIKIKRQNVTGVQLGDFDDYRYTFDCKWGIVGEKNTPFLLVTLGIEIVKFSDETKIADFLLETVYIIDSLIEEIPYESFCFLFFQIFGALQVVYLQEMQKQHPVVTCLDSPDPINWQSDFEEGKNNFIDAYLS